MKTIYFRLICLICMMAFITTICKADGGEPTIPIYTIPDNDNDGGKTNRAPALCEAYAIFNTTVSGLSLIVSPDIEVSVVEIYKNEVLIISDNIPTLYYILSAYGSGAYTVAITTNDGVTYTGTFNF